MDALRVIPQLFFDLIARVIPGIVALALFGIALQVNCSWFVVSLKEGPRVLNESTTLWVFTVLVLCYVLGHFLAPLSKLVQEFAHSSNIHVIEPVFNEPLKVSLALQRFVKADLGDPSYYQEHFEDEIWVWYDWLRVFVPSAGGLAARIRAEYTMYSSLSAAFIIAFLVRLPFAVIKFEPLFDITFLVATGVMAHLMLLRWRETERTFRLSVRNFYFVARACYDPRWRVSSTARDI